MSAIAFQLVTDTVSPALKRLSDPSLMSRCTLAAATVVSSLGQRAFDESSLRPTPWAARASARGGNHPLLLKSGTMRQSIFVRQEGGTSARIGTPVIYGATHQLGSKDGKTPARPFFPVLNNQLTGNANDMIGEAISILIGQAG
jgi:phage gpG-like protein